MSDELIDAGYRCYTGDRIDVYFNAARCQHSGNCVRGNSSIFKLDHKPWITPDNAAESEVMRVVKTCPSGALQYRNK
ncbi:(4Fe-4S)-binding protein [Edaphovirga cremea]|uniref:(4Fe-4S)-binding protein n=1 Tax=Edaphovirga cremea TaxID=2267246 RepID=UPI000DEF797D|nr:(4Fe-4S)-binding protein [Edaphovirga cremea]